ncbi:hypothetical protein SAY87_022678 [Trapa incisa]|uniref:DVL n=1 Tax=Trapa incisa TaxID=236973 RepID=A0AAN7K8J3_9MYRT|nr:hypothetical protein SAY87_022678 [Trapa incisa]
MAGKKEELVQKGSSSSSCFEKSACDPCRSFGQKCSHLVKKQRAKFYIVRRCVTMLLCWDEHKDP